MCDAFRFDVGWFSWFFRTFVGRYPFFGGDGRIFDDDFFARFGRFVFSSVMKEVVVVVVGVRGVVSVYLPHFCSTRIWTGRKENFDNLFPRQTFLCFFF